MGLEAARPRDVDETDEEGNDYLATDRPPTREARGPDDAGDGGHPHGAGGAAGRAATRRGSLEE